MSYANRESVLIRPPSLLHVLTWSRIKIDRLRDEVERAPGSSTLVRESTKIASKPRLRRFSCEEAGLSFVLSRTARFEHSCFRGPCPFLQIV